MLPAAIGGDRFTASVHSLLGAARRRRKLGLLINVLESGIILGAAVLLAHGVYYFVWALPYTLGRRELEGGFLEQLIGAAMVGVSIFLLPLLYAGLYLLPFAITLPISAFVIALWDEPPRYLVLRSFNRGGLVDPLRRLLRAQVSPLGHVYTLSDADIRIRWYIRVPLLLGQIALLSFRVRKIRSTGQVARLGRTIERTWMRNVNWCLSFAKTFPVASDDIHWQAVVRLMTERVDAVIIDATELRPNVLWEVRLCQELGRSDCVVFVVRADDQPAALARLRDALPDFPLDDRVFSYSDGGLSAPEPFRERLAALSVSAAAERRQGAAPRQPGWLETTAVLAFAVFMVPLLGLADEGLDFFPRWTPWKPGPWPGVAGVINPGAATMFTGGLVALALLLIGARRLPSLYFLVVLQLLLLMAAPLGMSDW